MDEGTLVGFREMLRKAAEARGQFDVDASSGPVSDPDTSAMQQRMANGGEVAPRLNPVQHALNSIAKKDTGISFRVPTPSGTTAPGVMVTKHFATGGEVMPDPMQFISDGFMTPSGEADPMPVPPTPAPAPAPAAGVPPLGDVSSAISKTPDTNYDFFKDLSADDRAALQQRLMAQKSSPGNLVAQGAAGLGDAISNSFGGKNTTFQKDVMANNELQEKSKLDAFDTHRTQKMQDMNANIEMQSNDPKSPLSMSMQRTFKSAGVNVPSGMPAAMMMKIAPALGELAMKQATMELQKQSTMAQQEISRQGQRNQSAEALAKTNTFDRIFHPDEVDQLRKNAGMGGADHGIPDLGATFNGGKVTKVTRIK